MPTPAIIEIWPTGAGAYVDYSASLFREGPVRKTHGLNNPQELNFDLIDAFGMTVPEAGNRVRVSTDTYANWFTGYLLRTPQRALLGKDPVSLLPVYGYRCQAASEEIRLEWQTAPKFPTLPPFVNKTQGEIIKHLIRVLSGNLASNGDSEYSTATPPAGWAVQGSPTISYETSVPYSGVRSVKISGAQWEGLKSSVVWRANPGELYEVSGALNSSGGVGAQFVVQFLDGALSQVGGVTASRVGDDTWSLVSGSGTAPAGTVYARILQRIYTASGGVANFDIVDVRGSAFDLSAVDDGILIPYFRVKPDEGFFDAVRRLSDRTGMRFWTSAGAAYYRPTHSFYNTGFEGWTGGVPRGWTSDGSAGLSEETTIVVAGSAAKITGNGATAVRGRIYQDATPFIKPNKAYSIKARLRKTAGLVAGTFVADLFGTGVLEQFKVTNAQLSASAGGTPFNALFWSHDLSNGAWAISQLTRTGNTTDVTDPWGGNRATKLVPNVGATNAAIWQYLASVSPFTIGDVVSGSAYLRTLSGTAAVRLRLIKNSIGNAFATSDVVVTSTWQRFELSGTLPAGSTQVGFMVGGDSSWIQADGSIYAIGAQLNLGATAADLIETNATRVAGTDFAIFTGVLTAGISSVPTDLQLRVFLENTPTNNESAYFDEMVIYETNSAWLVGADESLSQFNPYDLGVTPIQNPAFNDVVAVGEVEPQAYVREYFVGDGLTGVYPLRFQMFGAQSSKLLEDDFTGTAIDATRWTETDPSSVLSISGNSLAFVSAPAATLAKLTANQGLEIADVLELRAGRVRFNAPSYCIIGGAYSADTGLLADCVAGFYIFPGASQSHIQPIVNGAVAGFDYTTIAGKTYQLTLTLICASHLRRRRSFFSRLNQFGGENVTAQAIAEFSVIELPDNESDVPTQVGSYTATITNIPAFLFYTLISGPTNSSYSVDLKMNFTLLRKPLLCALWTRKTTDSGYILQKLGDKADPEARASVIQGAEGPQLTFFSDKLPEEEEKIKVFYRAAGQARARVRRDSSVTAEAARAGDSGVRAGTLPSLNPAPRDAAELERALQAYIEDRTTPAYDGEWKFDTRSYAAANEPVPGQILAVNAATRHAHFYALAHEVESEFLLQDPADSSDVILHTVKFGSVSRLEEKQADLGAAENALEGPLDSLTDVPQVEFNSVGTQFAADRPDAEFDGTITSSTIRLDAGAAPTSVYEVRKFDAGWATAQTLNKIVATNPTTQTFTIPRTSRDIVAFLKNKDGAGLVSRYPSAVRVVYPLVPQQPDALTVTHKTTAGEISTYLLEATIAETKLQDFYQLELRDEDNSTVLVRLGFESLNYEGGYYVGRYTFDNSTALDRARTFYAYQRNLLGEYSTARSAAVSRVVPLKPILTAGNLLGWVVEILFDQLPAIAEVVETEIQAIGPGGSFATPDVDIKLQSQPEKFSLTADVSGAWGFRARRRDAIGWSPWSNEAQGQIPGQSLFFSVGAVALVSGGTNADLSATGGTAQVLKQKTAGGAVAVETLAASEIPNIAQSQVTSLPTDLAAKVPTARTVTAGAGLSGGGDLSTDRTLSLATRTIGIPFIIDGGGAAITTGEKGHLEVPFACTVVGWTIAADQSGSIVVAVAKDTYANFPPIFTADEISGTEKPTLASAQKNQDLTLTTWTTAIAAGDILAYKVDSASTVTRALVELRVTIP